MLPAAGTSPVFSLVLPAYNPGPTIESTRNALTDFLDGQSEPWEAVIVLDGCTDDTLERLDSFSPDRRIRVVTHAANRGKGHAVRTGLLAARGEFRIFTDIDLAYGFDDILRVADTLMGGAAVAIASRTHPASELLVAPHLLGYAYRRHVQSVLFRRVARRLLPIRQTDSQAGLKGFSAAVVRHLLPWTECDGFGFDCELLLACDRCGIPVAEVPVSVRCQDRASTTGARSAFAMLRELWSIRRAWKRKFVPSFVASAREPAPARKAA
jgi:dolichyl-phosphate beta-glucosyltransferase